MFQELEEQRRKELSEKEALERWKEEERRKSQQEIGELRQLFLQESKDMASKSSSIEAVSINWFKMNTLKCHQKMETDPLVCMSARQPIDELLGVCFCMLL